MMDNIGSPAELNIAIASLFTTPLELLHKHKICLVDHYETLKKTKMPTAPRSKGAKATAKAAAKPDFGLSTLKSVSYKDIASRVWESQGLLGFYRFYPLVFLRNLLLLKLTRLYLI